MKKSDVHFVALTKKGSPDEIMQVILEEISISQKEGVLSYDSVSKKNCLIIPVIICVVADNPRAAELSATMGCSGLAPCRFCIISKSDLQNGLLSAPLKTLKQSALIRNVSQLLSNECKQKLLRMHGIKETPSAFERIPTFSFDVFKDFPVEILHTVLLGPIKYCVSRLKKKLNSQQNEEITKRLSGINWDGIKSRISPASYKYVGSWIGRDFKVMHFFNTFSMCLNLPSISSR
jgi:hypothetical protein